MLTQSRLKELFDYCPDTGIFVRKVNRSNTKKDEIAGCLGKGYYKIRIDDVLYLSHRLAWLYVYGTLPEFVDHINRISTDNRIDNLRPVTKAQNQQNHGIPKNNKSGYLGVSWDKARNKWSACIQHNNKTIGLGRYADIQMAYKAYQEAAKKYHTHNPHAI